MEISARPLSGGQARGRVYPVAKTEVKSEGAVTIDEARIRAQAALDTPERPRHATDEILDVYRALLADPALIGQVEEASRRGLPPTQAIRQAAEHFASQLEALDDPYLRERSQDVRDVAELWVEQLSPTHVPSPIPENSIIVTSRLTVQEVSTWPDTVKGAIVQHGSPTMHAALIAQGLGVPVVAVDHGDDWERLASWDWVFVDGDHGIIELLDGSPPFEPVEVAPPAPPPPVVKDVTVQANIGSIAEAAKATQLGAQGIGLLRTELAFAAEGRLPDMDGQTRLLTRLFQQAPKPIIIRTLDIGSDKPLLPWSMEKETNPALGRRGVRVYRQHPELFYEHLTAIVSAWRHHQPSLSVMFPMIASISDWLFCRLAFEKACRAQHVPAGAIELGVMAEVPALLWLLPDLHREGCQFISLGTNDLSQYLFASDRTTSRGTDSPLALARAITMLISEAERHSLTIHVCGNLAADPHWARYLVGLGARHLSVPVSRLDVIRDALSKPLPTDIGAWADGRLSERAFAQQLMQL
ncbi:putative PEP-binding protein [Sulfobacillus harzensis]|uniref:Phosphoenolpyruvate-protein phosphotransferase n=1 Tax=Sulfobacillus harzensis TaxID=2729629 RepID=A0A7Y0Q3J4_9FIRM|nr:putative PEP-binding protein [Sulfobacillus harzensis]NMP22249.1 phosphoenolpyruvate--protein phosphotransferase [Sulfobacillus harzensis]